MRHRAHRREVPAGAVGGEDDAARVERAQRVAGLVALQEEVHALGQRAEDRLGFARGEVARAYSRRRVVRQLLARHAAAHKELLPVVRGAAAV